MSAYPCCPGKEAIKQVSMSICLVQHSDLQNFFWDSCMLIFQNKLSLL